MTPQHFADVAEAAIKAALPAIVGQVTLRVEDRLITLVRETVAVELRKMVCEPALRAVVEGVRNQVEIELRRVLDEGDL